MHILFYTANFRCLRGRGCVGAQRGQESKSAVGAAAVIK